MVCAIGVSGFECRCAGVRFVMGVQAIARRDILVVTCELIAYIS